jgi:hypothetical protein
LVADDKRPLLSQKSPIAKVNVAVGLCVVEGFNATMPVGIFFA